MTFYRERAHIINRSNVNPNANTSPNNGNHALNSKPNINNYLRDKLRVQEGSIIYWFYHAKPINIMINISRWQMEKRG